MDAIKLTEFLRECPGARIKRCNHGKPSKVSRPTRQQEEIRTQIKAINAAINKYRAMLSHISNDDDRASDLVALCEYKKRKLDELYRKERSL